MTARKLDPPPVRRYTLFPCLSPISSRIWPQKTCTAAKKSSAAAGSSSALAITPTPRRPNPSSSGSKQEFPDATHNCWAYAAGAAPAQNPARSATVTTANRTARRGRPMLTMLLHGGVGELSAVVTRYFGGIKLGTGGLVRAYQGMVKLGLETLPTREHMNPARVEVVSELSAYYGLSPPAAGLPGHRRLGKLRRGRHLRTAASRSKHPGPRNRADGTHGRGSAHHTA